MSKQFELAEINNPIGTEILDPKLPSNIDFDHNALASDRKLGNDESTALSSKQVPLTQEREHVLDVGQLRQYHVKGRIIFKPEPAFHVGSEIKEPVETFQVKLFDEEPGEGFVGIWERVLGYKKRELFLHGGFIYIAIKTVGYFSKQSQLVVQSMYPIDSIFKVFADPEEDMLRIVTKDADRLLNRNYGVAELRLIIRKLNEQMIKTGLILNS